MPHLQDTHTQTHTKHPHIARMRASGIRKLTFLIFFYLFWDFFNVF